MRKWLAFATAAVLALTMTGCSIGVGDVTSQVTSDGQLVTTDDIKKQEQAAASQAQKDGMTDQEYEDSIAGLESYFKGLGAIAESATKMEMQPSFIGAKTGAKYTFNYNVAEKNTVAVNMELYEFDPNNLDGTAKQTIDSVKANGTFKLLNIDVSNAAISDNGKYLMIYTDNGKPEDEANNKHKQEVWNRFKTFKADKA